MEGVLLTVMAVSIIALSSGTTVNPPQHPQWDDLKVRYGTDISDPNFFIPQPRTVQDALDQGFEKLDGCECDTSCPWRGARYAQKNAPELILLFDVNGYIAGIQASIPNNLPNGYPKAGIRPPFVTDGNRYTASAYFVDPRIICTSGRSDEEFRSQGTGTDLYLQTNSNPEESTLIPKDESDIIPTKWTRGNCSPIPGQGEHFWYDLSDDMDCGVFFPVFLVYNHGELAAFGWAMTTVLDSPRYEQWTPEAAIAGVGEPAPKCLSAVDGFTLMHIYPTKEIALGVCKG